MICSSLFFLHIQSYLSMVSPRPLLSLLKERKKSDEIFQAAYGDYRRLCPSTFAVQGKEFAVLEEFSTELGQTGYVARVDFMEKIVIVFRGYDPAHSEEGGRLSWDVVPIDFGRPIRGCTAATNCTTGLGVLRLYNSARIATDNWRIAKQAVLDTGLKFSVTGHAIGGAVAQLAALDLGIDGFVHYAHSQAASVLSLSLSSFFPLLHPISSSPDSVYTVLEPYPSPQRRSYPTYSRANRANMWWRITTISRT